MANKGTARRGIMIRHLRNISEGYGIKKGGMTYEGGFHPQQELLDTINSYMYALNRIRSRHPSRLSAEELNLIDTFQEVYDLVADDNIDFDPTYINQLKTRGDRIVARFSSGHEESKG